MSADARIAVVVPVLGDAPALTRLFERIGAWPDPPAERIVVAAEPSPELESLRARFAIRIECCGANRGRQLDTGARIARADVLWFLHADAAPVAESCDAIREALARGAESGCFRFRFEGPASPTRAALAALVNARVRLGGIPYGDQGLFALKAAYLQSGGFAHQPLFEEVELVKRLRRRGTFVALPTPVGVSTRRWERDGWWRRSFRNRWLALRYRLGAPAERLAGSYYRAAETIGEARP